MMRWLNQNFPWMLVGFLVGLYLNGDYDAGQFTAAFLIAYLELRFGRLMVK